MSQIFGHIQSFAVRRDVDAGWEGEFAEAFAARLGALAVVELVIIAAAQNDLARLLSLTVVEIKDHHLVVIAARNEESFAIRREGQTEPRFLHAHGLRVLAGFADQSR